ncbi:MAG: (d)CMP kinase [Lachnospiraceae bacterium]|nr:(d)CMP kinase [Lachnospiraceae bacterium]MBR4174863.1 (d)CMP kinase [Lachnospiraceae bacterium]
MNVAIDGPAGAGKSTIAKIVAAKLGSIYVDTGAMYRAMALYLIRQGLTPSDEDKFSETCKGAKISLRHEDGVQAVFIEDENVNAYIRTPEVSNMASVSSKNADVREKLVSMQQELAKTTPVVMDGRDIGTKVLPDAEVKVYLTASVECRAKRRYDEMMAKGEACDLKKVEEEIADRDYRDMHRENSPLMQAEDAVLIDSTELTIEQVADEILKLCN